MGRIGRTGALFLAFALLVLSAGVGIWAVSHLRIEPGAHPVSFALLPRRFAELPGWDAANSEAALAAFRRSCTVLAAQPDAAPKGGAGYAGRAGDWKAVCRQMPVQSAGPAAARDFFESRFTPVEVRSAAGPPLFTGYYEPLVNGSRRRQGRFQQPVYGAPENLVHVDLQLFRPQAADDHIDGCVLRHRLVPCPTRAQIDAAPPPRTPVLLYTDDAVSLFFLHIQGSGRARLEDGSMVRLSYAAQNGRPYTPIGRVLIQRGLLDRGKLTMQTIRAWLQAHPGQARQIMEADQSYIFFRASALGDPALGSAGTEGVALTPQASVAVDPRIHPFGVPVYLVGERPEGDSGKMKPMASLFIAQDSGGAVRGPVRADIFWGFGDTAEAIAGRMKSGGRFFVLLPKTVAAHLLKRVPDPA